MILNIIKVKLNAKTKWNWPHNESTMAAFLWQYWHSCRLLGALLWPLRINKKNYPFTNFVILKVFFYLIGVLYPLLKNGSVPCFLFLSWNLVEIHLVSEAFKILCFKIQIWNVSFGISVDKFHNRFVGIFEPVFLKNTDFKGIH